jgi:ATPase family associated with various cellular activities (AAA)
VTPDSGHDHYLTDALAWLRARLEQMAQDGVSAPAAATRAVVAASPARSLFERVRRERPAAIPMPGPAPAPAAGAPAAPDGTPLLVLAQRLRLSEFERNVLLLCAAMELDTRIAALCARAQHDPAAAFPTFALALALFDDPAWDVLSPERPLRYWQLIDIMQTGAQPLVSAALRADERIVNFIKGLNYLDERIAPLLLPMPPDGAPAMLPPSQAGVVDTIARALAAGDGVVQLLGADSASKRLVALHVATARDVHLYRLPGDAVPAAAAGLDAFARLWTRECMLLPLGLYLDAADVERGDARAPALRRLLQRGAGLMFLDVRDGWPDIGPAAGTFDVAKPSAVEQRDAWLAVLGERAGEQPARLAGQFNLDLAAIARIAADAQVQGGDPAALPARLWNASLMHARPALDQLAQRIDTRAGWDDLKLPPQQEAQLRQIASQVGWRGTVYDDYGFRDRMTRGLGISVLFAGDSGTGKTMAAEVIARELGLLLYRIDLSAVVSKYIGETEKNLRKLFDAAEDGGAILFFDEADALFGKRSEVKDSHDRYANIEINYLLQRIEAYRGLAILATNMKSALDPAFMRRLRFIVHFPFPGAVQRKAMWESAFPAATPSERLDYAHLSRLNFSGGNIQTVALNCAFVAASSGKPVDMAVVLDAARAELRKLEKPVNEADFRAGAP